MAKISMYTMSTCPICWEAKEFFRARSILFEFIDYDLSTENEQNNIAAEMMESADDIGFQFVRSAVLWP